MSILIRNMEMPTTGLYFVGVDNSNGFDKTVVTVERMLGNRDVCQIIGSYEAVPVPPHGRLFDADEFLKRAIGTKCFHGDYALMLEELVGESTTIIPAEEGE